MQILRFRFSFEDGQGLKPRGIVPRLRSSRWPKRDPVFLQISRAIRQEQSFRFEKGSQEERASSIPESEMGLDLGDCSRTLTSLWSGIIDISLLGLPAGFFSLQNG